MIGLSKGINFLQPIEYPIFRYQKYKKDDHTYHRK